MLAQQRLCSAPLGCSIVNSVLRSTLSTRHVQNVHVTITDGADVIVDQKLAVTYSSDEINGPGGGVCTEAQVDVDF